MLVSYLLIFLCAPCHILSQWLSFPFKVWLICVQLRLLRGLDSNCHWSCCRRADVFASSRRDESRIRVGWKCISQKGLPQGVSVSPSVSHFLLELFLIIIISQCCGSALLVDWKIFVSAPEKCLLRQNLYCPFIVSIFLITKTNCPKLNCCIFV